MALKSRRLNKTIPVPRARRKSKFQADLAPELVATVSAFLTVGFSGDGRIALVLPGIKEP